MSRDDFIKDVQKAVYRGSDGFWREMFITLFGNITSPPGSSTRMSPRHAYSDKICLREYLIGLSRVKHATSTQKLVCKWWHGWYGSRIGTHSSCTRGLQTVGREQRRQADSGRAEQLGVFTSSREWVRRTERHWRAEVQRGRHIEEVRTLLLLMTWKGHSRCS